ncbi:MAG: hypothetical protein K2Y30_16015 [Flavobacteriaceae bacterium]|nr:hypothetical protein [Flavobacteriaceae bacterium]
MLKKFYLFLLLFSSCFIFCQGWEPDPADPGFGGGSGDPATEPVELPIDSIEVPLIITAVGISFYFFMKRKSKLTS